MQMQQMQMGGMQGYPGMQPQMQQKQYPYMGQQQPTRAPVPPAVSQDRAVRAVTAATAAAAPPPPAVSAWSAVPDKAGKLWKQKHSITKTMHEFHMELHGCELRYFALNEARSVPRRVVNVQDCHCSNGQTTALLKHFVLHTPKDSNATYYVLAHESEEEVRAWRAALEAAAKAPFKDFVGPDGQRGDAPNVVALVNSKSGGKQGEALIAKIKKHLGEANVVDIKNGGPQKALRDHKEHADNTRFLVCGGDGTVGWALQDLDKVRDTGDLAQDVPFAVLPLGTGNDMARTLGCGGGYGGQKLLPILENAAKCGEQGMDRWMVHFSGQDAAGAAFQKSVQMCNYFSIGWDALVARSFHVKRETSPGLFKNRTINKLWYAYYAFPKIFGSGVWDVSRGIKVKVDGREVELPAGIGAFLVINIPSYSGGTDLWGKAPSASPLKKPATDDQMLELVGTYGPLYQGTIMAGMRHAIRIAQGKTIEVETKHPREGGPQPRKGACFQVDGEPYMADHSGLVEDVRYKAAPPPNDAMITLKVKIEHLKLAKLVAVPQKGGGCCGAPNVE